MIRTSLISLCLSVASASALAVPTVYTDADQFASDITGSLSYESFEGYRVTDRTLSNFQGPDYSISSANDRRFGVENNNPWGGNATDGNNVLGFSQRQSTVTYAFDAPINTFAVTILDFGDGVYMGDLLFSTDAFTTQYSAAVMGADANQQFFGFVSDVAFTEVYFTQPSSQDYYAIDEMQYGVTAVPEPSSLGLLGLGLLALLRLRKKNPIN